MSSRNRLIGLAAIAIILVGATSFFVTRNRAIDSRTARDVVVLDNGQIYFGYLSDTDKEFMTLRDVFYPQDPSTVFNTNRDVKKKVSLFHYGDEVYGPESVMRIHKDNVRYFSAMRSNSKINEAIDRYSAGGEASTETTAPAE